MELLHKDDIAVLDSILKDLVINEKLELGNDFRIYLAILNEWDVINPNLSGSHSDGIFLHSNGVITERFFTEGGFKKKYEEQQEEFKKDKIIEEGNLANARISKWTKKTYWFTFGIAIAGFIISLVALYFAIIK